MGKSNNKRKERYSSSSESESESDTSIKNHKKKKTNNDELLKNAMEMIPKISKKDYYNKSNEFQYWLRKKKKIYFNDLKTEKAKKYFKKFAKKWNNAELDKKYYEGSLKMDAMERTSYKWNFNNKSDNELTRIKDSVETMTENGGAYDYMRKGKSYGPSPSNKFNPVDYESQQIKREEEAKNKYLREKQERRRFRKDQMNVIDELVPKATGRDALIEKRRQLAAFHRANSERDLDVEIPEQELMGGDDFKAKLRERDVRNKRREEMKQRNQAQMSLKVEAYKKKEEATMNMLRKMAEERFARENK